MKAGEARPKLFYVWDDSVEDNKPAEPNIRAWTPHDAAERYVNDEPPWSVRDEIEVAVQDENEATPTLYVVHRAWVAETSPRKWEP